MSPQHVGVLAIPLPGLLIPNKQLKRRVFLITVANKFNAMKWKHRTNRWEKIVKCSALARPALLPSGVIGCLILLSAARAWAIDQYEIQIYTTETAPLHKLTLELHSNGVVNAVGHLAKDELRPHEIHETLEATYGLWSNVEIGQYLATAKFVDGGYGYAGSRTKIHFGIGDPETWPIAFGGNIELDYMRRQAEDNPLTLEFRPIISKSFGKLSLVADFAFEKPFRGPGTHDGVTFSPSGWISYEVLPWLTPSIEYYGDMGPVMHLPSTARQQHFVVPTINLDLLPQLELNFGVGIGTTKASRATFIKSIIGWTF
jgi:hypothetical protein